MQRVKEEVNKNSKYTYDWFKEETGDHHWVLYISDKWKTNRVDSFKMFEDCYSLPNFNEEKIDAEMAKPVEQGGYLILK